MKCHSVCLLIILAANLWAQWSSDSTVNNPICTASNYQQFPQLVDDGNGGAIIVWEDSRFFNDDNIYSQLISSDGYPAWTIDGVAVSSAADDQVTPQITSDGSGGAIVVWQDNRTGNADIYAQRIDNNGISQWTADGIPICTAINQQFEPKIISDGNGGGIIVWKDYRSGLGYDIYAQRVDMNGNVLWTVDGAVICSAVYEQSNHQIIAGSSEGAIIAWQDKRYSAFDIYAQKIDNNGNILWANNGVRVCTEGNDQLNCQLINDNTNGAIIVWHDIRNASNVDIYAQRINEDGFRLWDTSGVAVCNAAGSQFSPQITSDLNGGAIICWTDYRNVSGDADIYSQRINSNGDALWALDGIDVCSADNNQEKPDIISDETGGAILVWQDNRTGSADIYAQRVISNGNLVWTSNGVPISVPALDQTLPQLIFTANNNAIITWQDRRSGNYDIYASLVDTIGRLAGTPVYVDNQENLPLTFQLFQNYPNPFNPTTKISWQSPIGSWQTLKIYDLLGNEIATLVNEYLPAGNYEKKFSSLSGSAWNLSSGIYFYILQAGNYIQAKKMILTK
ncbi:MAG TPA: T9SS type A sorting domain-containing protein [Ignavibacteriaceae bacterium]|nr:T9SS type A sorting domain-containing protein [Ignavibacteriaceae bacterium]